MAATLLASIIASVALAQSSGGAFAIPKGMIAGGGGTSSGGTFVLSGTIGESLASPQSSEGGEFLLSGGFWAGGISVPSTDTVFGDGFEP